MIASLTIAALVYGPHLLDLTVPAEEDVRAHVFKIALLHDALLSGCWPVWTPFWYDGYPLFQYYPPAFYVLGAVLTFITGHAVIAYKLLMFAALAANGLSTYYFARRFVRVSPLVALACLVIYQSSTGVLLNCMYGVGPNLLGWSIGVAFLTVYGEGLFLGTLGRRRTSLVAGLLLGLAVLTHPFPVVFVAMATAVMHAIKGLGDFRDTTRLKSDARHLATVGGTGALIGACYWLPFIATRHLVSPIQTTTSSAWPGGTTFILLASFPALIVCFATLFRARRGIRVDCLIAFFLLSLLLGFGAARYLPFGLGSLVHEFRFATLMLPMFALLLCFLSAEVGPPNWGMRNVAVALLLTLAAAALVIAVSGHPVIGFFMQRALEPGHDINGLFVARVLARQLLPIAIAIVPMSWIALAALSPARAAAVPVPRPLLPVALTSVSAALLLSILPYQATSQVARLDRLFSYVENYRTADYEAILENVQGSRLVIPSYRGYLLEGDSLVTFAWQRGVETVNGAYNQGDPKFFKHTVHLEWEERWFDHRTTRENLMQECGAGYVFIRAGREGLEDNSDLQLVCANSYGRLLTTGTEVARAVNVEPVLLDVARPDAVTHVLNVLMPQGYRMVLVDAKDVPPHMLSLFAIVLVDDAGKVAEYAGRHAVVLVNDCSDEAANASPIPADTIAPDVTLTIPLAEWNEQWFYTSDPADVRQWGTLDWQLRQLDASAFLEEVAAELSALQEFAGQLTYEPVGYEYSDTVIHLNGIDGFTLIKDTWFPWWRAENGAVLRTTQGFTLVHTEAKSLIVSYTRPAYVAVAAAVTIAALVVVTTLLVMPPARREMRRRSA